MSYKQLLISYDRWLRGERSKEGKEVRLRSFMSDCGNLGVRMRVTEADYGWVGLA
jgi:hypothetical protein